MPDPVPSGLVPGGVYGGMAVVGWWCVSRDAGVTRHCFFGTAKERGHRAHGDERGLRLSSIGGRKETDSAAGHRRPSKAASY